MKTVKVKSKQYHGDYYNAVIYESPGECKGTIVDYKSLTTDNYKGTFCVSIEGLVVPVLKVTSVKSKYGTNVWIYFPKLRLNQKKGTFSYNIDIVQQDRYQLNYKEKMFAGLVLAGLNAFEAAKRTWAGKKDNYYLKVIKRLFNTYDFIEYLFTLMNKSFKQELIDRGITKGTIADKVAEFITGIRIDYDKETGKAIETPVRVPQNLALWALNKASDLLERGSSNDTPNNGTFGNDEDSDNAPALSPAAMKALMAKNMTTETPTNHTASDQMLKVSSEGNSHVVLQALEQPYE